MSKALKLRSWVAAALLATCLVPSAATAGHRDHWSCAKPDVDIDALKAGLRYSRGQWRLSVKYEVETEDAAPGRFDLVLRMTQRRRLIVDHTGRPITFVVPLDRPDDVDDDEMEYKGRFAAVFANGLFASPKSLDIEARIVDRHTGRVVAHKKKSIEYKR